MGGGCCRGHHYKANAFPSAEYVQLGKGTHAPLLVEGVPTLARHYVMRHAITRTEGLYPFDDLSSPNGSHSQGRHILLSLQWDPPQ